MGDSNDKDINNERTDGAAGGARVAATTAPYHAYQTLARLTGGNESAELIWNAKREEIGFNHRIPPSFTPAETP